MVSEERKRWGGEGERKRERALKVFRVAIL